MGSSTKGDQDDEDRVFRLALVGATLLGLSACAEHGRVHGAMAAEKTAKEVPAKENPPQRTMHGMDHGKGHGMLRTAIKRAPATI